MGKSVEIIERNYGPTKILAGIEFEMARRRKYAVADRAPTDEANA